MKIKIDWLAVLLWFAIAFIFAVWLCSCNPVKQVLSDKRKFDKVAEEVIRQGYCANDTIMISSSDTTIKVDTLRIIDEIPYIEIMNDTVYVTKLRTNTVTKTVIIRDTIKSLLVDNARIQLLQKDLLKANEDKLNWKERANKTFGYLLLLIMGIGVYLFLKFKK